MDKKVVKTNMSATLKSLDDIISESSVENFVNNVRVVIMSDGSKYTIGMHKAAKQGKPYGIYKIKDGNTEERLAIKFGGNEFRVIHPNWVSVKKKKVDWGKVKVDTLIRTNAPYSEPGLAYFYHHTGDNVWFFANGATSVTAKRDECGRLKEFGVIHEDNVELVNPEAEKLISKGCFSDDTEHDCYQIDMFEPKRICKKRKPEKRLDLKPGDRVRFKDFKEDIIYFAELIPAKNVLGYKFKTLGYKKKVRGCGSNYVQRKFQNSTEFNRPTPMVEYCTGKSCSNGWKVLEKVT